MKFAAWNTEGRLAPYLNLKSKRGTPEHILSGIKALNADVLVLPEAFNGPQPAPEVELGLKELDYEMFCTPYNDPDREEETERYGESNICILSRIGFVATEVIRFGGIRNLPVAIVQDPDTDKKIRIMGIHQEDRSSAQREAQLDDFIPYVNSSDLPVIAAGDFNELPPGWRAKIAGSRGVYLIAKYVLKGDLASEFTRLNEMANGNTVQRLISNTDLREVDTHHLSTVTAKKRNFPYLPATKLCKLDRMLVSSELEAAHFKVEKDSGSDHRAISANVTFK